MNNTNHIIDIIFSLIGILPAILVLFLFKNAKPNYHGLWMLAALLIGVGILVAGSGYEILQLAEDYIKLNKQDIEMAKEAKIRVSIWAYVFPGVTIALGVNLLTEFLLRDPPIKKPSKSD